MISNAIECQFLSIKKPVDVMEYWTNEVIEVTKVNKVQILNCYSDLLKMMNESVLKGKLELDDTIWPKI
jgi:hypothetical protein